MIRSTSFIILLTVLQHSQAAIIEPNTLWDKSEIEACFYTPSTDLSVTDLLSPQNARKNFLFAPTQFNEKQKTKINAHTSSGTVRAISK